ncbi:MAG: tRNA uridine(34) 5-carboxymethylaminomethyl modification radical SAM/GNAT enzyme Elp3 [Candidatus Magasanikbacteria bacterium]|nr:tRNA uridine(34) 5-carboxymethylaminomethyl modification radical SAM/GNAT enzyme Elp3 [Candidatus Magasanikbacteria bacterium]
MINHININSPEKIILKIITKKPRNKAEFDDARRKVCSKLKIPQISNRNLLKAYQNLVKKKRVEPNKQLEFFMRKANIRTLSGVAIVTSLTKPHPCPGNCIYCPDEIKMPKSYLATEPAAARALALKFDPYRQMQKRIEMLARSGHPTDKIEYIVKGGTWNAYPLKYQYWFVLESFKACNNLSRKKKTSTTQQYNNITIEKLKKQLKIEQNYNDKHAKHKIIGLTLETRPDAITAKTIYDMRIQGCTRIELGLQAPDDKILKLIRRGHTVEQFKKAILLLRQTGFKVDLHFMPDLPGTTANHDVEMYKLLFSDPGFKPDMVKIYPCTVIKTAKLYNWYKSGKYKPYSDKKLFEALIEIKTNTPRYCRISRLIRDIPTTDIKAGNLVTNLREELKKEMDKRGLKCRCLRCREVGHSTTTLQHNNTSATHLFVDEYETVGGDEYFISFEDKKRQTVFGFLRLRLPNFDNSADLDNLYKLMPEIKDCAFIRELHVYGQLVGIGKQDNKATQHKGMGKKLVSRAEKIAKKAGFTKIAVISGVGVRNYYRKLGYKKQGTYMVKKI